MNYRVLSIAASFLTFAGISSAADQQLLNLLMPDAKVVAGVNVDQAKNSPFGQFLLAHVPANDQGLQNLLSKTGFDPRRDLTEVLMGTIGQPGEKGLVLARGTFNSQQILSAAVAGGQTVQNYKGINIVTGQQDSMTHAVAFLDDTIAVAGDLQNVQGAIDRRTGTASAIDPALAAKVGQLSASEDAWSVSLVPIAALAPQNVPNTNLNGMLNSNVLKSIQQSSGGIKFGANIQFTAEAVADTANNASALASVVQFLANMVQSNAPAASAAAVSALVQSLNVKADGQTVTVALTIPEVQLENLVNSAPQHKSMHGHSRL